MKPPYPKSLIEEDFYEQIRFFDQTLLHTGSASNFALEAPKEFSEVPISPYTHIY